MRVRVLLYTDQPILKAALAVVLENCPDISLDSADSIAALLAGFSNADVALLDLTPEVTFSMLADLKQRGGNTKVVLWAREVPRELAFQAMGLGVVGIVGKKDPVATIPHLLRSVHSGEVAFDGHLLAEFVSMRRVALTQREGQLVLLVAEGLKNKAIAHRLMISEGTVKVYLSRLFQKVGCVDRFELALWAIKNLVSDPASKPRTPDDTILAGPRALAIPRRVA